MKKPPVVLFACCMCLVKTRLLQLLHWNAELQRALVKTLQLFREGAVHWVMLIACYYLLLLPEDSRTYKLLTYLNIKASG